MKGKKFTAAEKHFEKRRLLYQKQINRLNEQLDNAHSDIRIFKSKYETAERKNEELETLVEKLLEYTDLSVEDIKQACARDERTARAIEWLGNFGGRYYTQE